MEMYCTAATVVFRYSCSGFHRQKTSGGSASGSGEKTEGQPKRNLNHEFATPRVKSAAKSRKAVALLNSIVDAKDDLLKQAIVSMDRSTRNHLISKNNDFVKFVSTPFASRQLYVRNTVVYFGFQYPSSISRTTKHKAIGSIEVKIPAGIWGVSPDHTVSAYLTECSAVAT